MASLVFQSYLTDSIAGDVFLVSSDIKCALMTSSYTPASTDTTFDDTYEVIGSGYTPGGKSIQGKIALEGTLRCSDLVWTSCTISDVRWAVLYDASNSNRLVAAIDFETARRSRGGSFRVEWGSSGVIRHRSG